LVVFVGEIVGAGGEVLVGGRGLLLRLVDGAAHPGALGSRSADNPWPPALLAPYLERRVKEILPLSGISVLLVANGNNGRSHGILHRPDGKPLAVAGHVSRSRAGNLTMTVGGAQPVGCDCEAVAGRTPDLWRDLLGQDGFALAGLLARDLCEDLDRSCTRVWCALESVKKAGGRRDLALALSSPRGSMAEFDGWVVLRAGPASIATLVAPVAGFAGPLAFALMVGA
jgi:enediyne polyketide synthase